MTSSTSLTPLETTLLELVAIGEVHPNEDKVLSYIKQRLTAAKTPFKQDQAGNIVAQLPDSSPKAEPLALVGHVDIAAPLGSRQVVVTNEHIKTDGTGLLGADDKAAVAVMLELADTSASQPLARPIELIFTIGEEAGTIGAIALDTSLVKAKQALVLDWTGSVNHIVTQSPAYYQLDVTYTGRTAHPSEWQHGRNAGAALMSATSALRQGEYEPGVTFNVGILQFGQARNQVPGEATLQAELRSFDMRLIEKAAIEIESHFLSQAENAHIEAKVVFDKDAPAYKLDQTSQLFTQVKQTLTAQGLQANLQPTYGCFDGNILAARGLEVIMLGAAYYLPHSPSEYLNRTEFAELFEFCKRITLSS